MTSKSGDLPIPFQDSRGHWVVGDQWFNTNREAWLYIDKMEHSPISRAEDTNLWMNKKMLDEFNYENKDSSSDTEN